MIPASDSSGKPGNHAERAAVERFKVDVCDQSGGVDPKDEREWESLCFGFLLGCRLAVPVASRLALYIKNDRRYFMSGKV